MAIERRTEADSENVNPGYRVRRRRMHLAASAFTILISINSNIRTAATMVAITREPAMSPHEMVATILFVSVFAIFGAVLAYGDWYTSRRG